MNKQGSPASRESLRRAEQLLAEGVSQREICRTLRMSRTTLRRHFPGRGWTYKEGGAFRALIRHYQSN